MSILDRISVDDVEAVNAFDPSAPDQEAELAAFLVKGLCGDSRFSAHVACEKLSDFASPPTFSSLEGLREDSPWLNNYYFHIDAKNIVSADFMLDVLRTTGLALFSDEGDWEWLIWDPQRRCISATSSFSIGRAFEARRRMTLDRGRLPLHDFLHRAWLATDHGLKPLLLNKRFLETVKRRETVPFVIESAERLSDFEEYHLVYFDAKGEVHSVPFAEAASFGEPIATRNCTYHVSGDGVTASLRPVDLLAGGLRICVKHKPRELERYARRLHGTVFQSGFYRLEASSVSYAGEYRSVPSALERAEQFAAETIPNAEIWFTSGGHPLNCEMTTTAKLYLQGLQTVARHGIEVRYGSMAGVVLRREGAPTQDDFEVPF